MIEWFKMAGHGFYIWSAYAMLAVAVLVELALLRAHRRRALQQVLQAIEEGTQ
ncbi:MAG: heme exporter protein CcmD [Quisquiliibacterium sp.]